MHEYVNEYVLTMLAAAAVTYLLTPLVRRFAIATGALHAARDRDVHVVPTPLLGGVAMYAGLAVGLLVARQLPALNSVFAQTNMAKGLLLAGGLVVIMGFIDDRWGMSVISKLAGQVAAGVILVWSGAEVTWLPVPGRATLSLTSDQQTAVTILVVVVTINAVNFIDGLDGLAAGIVGIGAAAFFIYYYTLTQRLGLPDQTGPALASAVLAGMCLGFLPHNFHPARIFMGDTGAMLIGLLLAYAPISSLASLDPGSLTNYDHGTVNRFGAILPLLLPAAILLLPYADLLMAVVRRTRAGMSPFAPDKKHLHHRLLDIGHSHRTSVLIMYLWAALFAGSVVWLSIQQTPLPVLVGVTVACVLALLLVSMPRLRPWTRSTAAPASQPARGQARAVPGAAAATAQPAGAPLPQSPGGPAEMPARSAGGRAVPGPLPADGRPQFTLRSTVISEGPLPSQPPTVPQPVVSPGPAAMARGEAPGLRSGSHEEAARLGPAGPAEPATAPQPAVGVSRTAAQSRSVTPPASPVPSAPVPPPLPAPSEAQQSAPARRARRASASRSGPASSRRRARPAKAGYLAAPPPAPGPDQAGGTPARPVSSPPWPPAPPPAWPPSAPPPG